MSPSNGSAPTATIPKVNGTVTKVANVTIRINRTDPISKTLDPPAGTPVEMSFIHQEGGPPTHARPHGVVWMVEGLRRGEWLEIQLDTCFPGFASKPKHAHQVPWWNHLQKLFPNAIVLASGAFGFHLDFEAPYALSGHAVSKEKFEIKKSGPNSRPLIHYKIVLFDEHGQEHELDPAVDVTPDP